MVLDAGPILLARRQCAALDGIRPWDAAVIMIHHLESDVSYMRALADAQGPQYIGLLGPTARRNHVVHALGFEAAGIESRLRGPVGLNIGAVTPESVALAIVSEIHAWLAQCC